MPVDAKTANGGWPATNAPAAATLPPGRASALSRRPPGIAPLRSGLPSPAVVLDAEDRVLQASDAARSFGLVKGERLMASELLALARQVRRDGEIREGEFEVPA